MRVVSGVVLAVAAFGVTWWGGLAFSLFFGAVALLIFWEWVSIVGAKHFSLPALIGYGVVLASQILLWFGAWPIALLLPVAGFVALILLRSRHARALWCAFGILYAAAFGLSMLALRFDQANGFSAILILFAVVWGTDVAAYFAGKTIGGPKLWPRVSPKKTWSGSLGGLIIGAAFALLVAAILGIAPSVKLAGLLGALSLLSQMGDLAESHMKRLFDVKDSSNLIPGHGGVMDRVDGLIVAVVCAALVGLVLGDIGSVATGFLIW